MDGSKGNHCHKPQIPILFLSGCRQPHEMPRGRQYYRNQGQRMSRTNQLSQRPFLDSNCKIMRTRKSPKKGMMGGRVKKNDPNNFKRTSTPLKALTALMASRVPLPFRPLGEEGQCDWRKKKEREPVHWVCSYSRDYLPPPAKEKRPSSDGDVSQIISRQTPKRKRRERTGRIFL